MIGELINIVAEAKKVMFAETSFIKLDISLAKGNEYEILHFKRSKTDIEHTEL